MISIIKYNALYILIIFVAYGNLNSQNSQLIDYQMIWNERYAALNYYRFIYGVENIDEEYIGVYGTVNEGKEVLSIGIIDKENGELVNKKVFNKFNHTYPSDIVFISKNEFIVAGSGITLDGNGSDESDILIIKYSFEEGTIWENTIGGSKVDEAIRLAIQNDYVYLVGNTKSTDNHFSGNKYNNLTPYLIKIHSGDGAIKFVRLYGEQSHNYTNETIFIDEKSNLIYISGEVFRDTSYINGNEERKASDSYIVQINKEGEIFNYKEYGGNEIDESEFRFRSIENKLYCFRKVGYWSDIIPRTEIYLIRDNLLLELKKSIDRNNDWIVDLKQGCNNNVLMLSIKHDFDDEIAGHNGREDIMISFWDNEFTLTDYQYFGSSESETGSFATDTSRCAVYVNSKTGHNQEYRDGDVPGGEGAWIFKLKQREENDSSKYDKLCNRYKIAPNPSSDQITIHTQGEYRKEQLQYSIYNNTGSLVRNGIIKSQYIADGGHNILAANLSSGIYYIKLSNINNYCSLKLVIINEN